MGIDYVPFTLRENSSREELIPLIEKQAIGIQSNPYIWGTNNRDHITTSLLNHLHREKSILASYEIEKKIYLTDVSFRVYPITSTQIFPPFWAIDAHRTILPDELYGYVDKWRTWITDVKLGKHRDYLLNLYCGSAFNALSDHYYFQSQVKEWLSKPRTKDRLSNQFFDQVLMLDIPIDEPRIILDVDCFDANDKYQRNSDVVNSSKYSELIAKLIPLIHEWNINSSGKWKVRCYLSKYQNLDTFIAGTNFEWINQFFDWCQKCLDNKQGLFLCY